MERNNEHSSETSNGQPRFIGEIDLEALEFRPINKGLGFHKEQGAIRPHTQKSSITPKSIRPRPTNNFSTSRATAQEEVAMPFIREEGANRTSNIPTTPLPTSSSLGRHSRSVGIGQKNESPRKRKALKAAKNSSRAMAFGIDLIVLILALGIPSFTAPRLLLGPKWQEIILRPEPLFFLLFVFCVSFVFYFSILDTATGLGKSFLKIKVYSHGDKRPSLLDCAQRSFLTLISIPFLGVLQLLNVIDRMTLTSIKETSDEHRTRSSELPENASRTENSLH